jgi:predicted GNAT superfamily acetyltransferase
LSSTSSPPEIRIETLTDPDQFNQCVDLQDVVWGYDLSAMMTQKVFLLASRSSVPMKVKS